MSTRLGMADSRCTNYQSSRIFNDDILSKLELNQFSDSEKYRAWLRTQDPETFSSTNNPMTCNIFTYKDDFTIPNKI
jgi:hypothetical protein